MDLAYFGCHASASHDTDSTAVDDGGAGKNHALFSLDVCVLQLDLVAGLVNRSGLTSERTLLDA
uniref:Uncharacterized protein n=1 Tax=Arundo donax TaxID=35708 RepID=A0A0A9D253_ARUDO